MPGQQRGPVYKRVDPGSFSPPTTWSAVSSGSNAEAALSGLYGRWTEQQGWLHMIIVHQELDETEALLQRCIALAQQQDDAGLRSDIAELRTQFTLLSEMQRLTLRNIL